MLSTIRDITERKVAEDQLRETNRQLEVALEELRRTQAQLVRQERLAAVGQLAAGIAHDFNNILSVILLQAQLALRTPEVTSSEVTPLGGIKPAATALRERLTTVAQQAGRAGDLVQQILDFSRSAVLQTRPLNVDDFFREQVELLRRTLDGQIRVRLEGEATNIIMNVDPTRLQQLFTNLALNARDAMPQGGELVITLDLLRDAAVVTQPGTEVVAVMDGRHESPERDAGSWLRIGVRDTGLGIPASKLPRIFEPFFTTKQPGQGTGLGLAQVYGIVKQHNGHIDVRSEEGAGTTFTIYLPVSSATEPHLQSRGAREWAGEMPHGKGQTILVVEEDLSLARALEDTLAALGYVPLVATDRAGAAHWIEQERESIALVISDLTTGDLAMNDLGSREPFSTSQPPPGQSTATLSPAHADGRSAFEAALHAQAAFFEELNVPVVVLTGPEPAQREQTLLAEGITGWLPKPPELERLAHLLARLLAEAPDR